MILIKLVFKKSEIIEVYDIVKVILANNSKQFEHVPDSVKEKIAKTFSYITVFLFPLHFPFSVLGALLSKSKSK